jgi:hypothetical protein
MTKALCPPVLNATPFAPPNNLRADCARFNAQTLDWIKSAPSVRTVILSARWPIYVGASYPRHGVTPILATETIPETEAQARALMSSSLQDMIQAIKAAGKEVIVIGPMPDFYQGGGKCVERARRFGWPDTHCAANAVETESRMAPVEAALKQASAGAIVVPGRDIFCGPQHCEAVKDGRLQFRDDNHVTPDGARRIIERLP